jgi:hypothetical protein
VRLNFQIKMNSFLIQAQSLKFPLLVSNRKIFLDFYLNEIFDLFFLNFLVQNMLNDPIMDIFNHPSTHVDIPERATVVIMNFTNSKCD